MTIRELLPAVHRHDERGLHVHLQAATCKMKPRKPKRPKTKPKK